MIAVQADEHSAAGVKASKQNWLEDGCFAAPNFKALKQNQRSFGKFSDLPFTCSEQEFIFCWWIT